MKVPSLRGHLIRALMPLKETMAQMRLMAMALMPLQTLLPQATSFSYLFPFKSEMR
jgi:hypothetical protein